MSHLLLAALAVLVAVCLAQIVYLRSFEELTWAMCAITVSFSLYPRGADRRVDPLLAEWTGIANISDLGHILGTLTAWWAMGLIALGVLRRVLPGRRIFGKTLDEGWTWFNGVLAGVVLVVWATSELPTTEVYDVLELRDASSRTLAIMYGSWALIGGTLLVGTAVLGLRSPGSPKPTVLTVFGVGLCGIGYALTAAAVLLFRGWDVLEEHSTQILGAWSALGIVCLAGSGFGGVKKRWLQRTSPA